MRGPGADRQGAAGGRPATAAAADRDDREQGPALLRTRRARSHRDVRRGRGRRRAARGGRAARIGSDAGPPDAGRYRAHDLHVGLHRQAQGRDAELPQHAGRGAGHRGAPGDEPRQRAPVLSAAVPCGRADAVDLRADLSGRTGEFRRIDTDGAGRSARGGAHDLPRGAAHLGKTACRHLDQDAGSGARAAMAVPARARCARPVP
ncbi:hypothetical protein FQZ97_827170 [compost metagenome]